MEKVQVKVYMPKSLAEKLDDESVKSGESKSFIVSEATKKELKRRGSK
ncbi:hypothetical protein ZP9_00005 [Shewanella phage ZP9]|nr:hypothetical protein ZP9_00005 [Shewanella phage ZP9]